MCGINGIIFKTSKTDVSKILQMNEFLDHRGPDDSGFINHKNLLLGHTRLSIIDTTNLGSQPMSVDGRYWIVYNGEIYNYKSLREKLIIKKYNFFRPPISVASITLNQYPTELMYDGSRTRMFTLAQQQLGSGAERGAYIRVDAP